MRVLQLFSSPFERSVERGECGLVHRVHRVGQGLTGLPVAPDHDLHDPHGGVHQKLHQKTPIQI